MRSPVVNTGLGWRALLACAVAIAVCGTPAAAAAEPWTLTEAQMLEWADAVPVPDERREAEQASIDAEVSAGRLLDDPVLRYAHRQLLTDPIVTEGELGVGLVLDSSDRREAWLRVGDHAAEVADAEVELARRAIRIELREGYYELAALELRLAAHDAWIVQLESGLVALTQREEAGDAALWERLRLEREIANAVGERAVLDAERTDTWVEMRDTLALAEPGLEIDAPQTTEPLLPDAPTPLVEGWVQTHPALQALDAERAEARARRDTATGEWLRDWEVGAGYAYEVVDGIDGHGFTAAIGIPLRVFDRLGPERDAADARAVRAEVDAAILARTLTVGAETRFDRAVRLRDDAIAFADAAKADIAALGTAVDAGYAGGEIQLVELLDMARANYDTEVVAIELALAARVARLRLDAIVDARPGDRP